MGNDHIANFEQMNYKPIYTLGRAVDDIYEMKGYRSDLLLCDSQENYYELNYILPDTIKNGFDEYTNCYFDINTIVIQDLKFETIVESIRELHRRNYVESLEKLTIEQLENHFFPKEKWEKYDIRI